MNAQELVDNVSASLRDADGVAANHFPGHELYAVESYLSAIAWTLLWTIATSHGVKVEGIEP